MKLIQQNYSNSCLERWLIQHEWLLTEIKNYKM